MKRFAILPILCALLGAPAAWSQEAPPPPPPPEVGAAGLAAPEVPVPSVQQDSNADLRAEIATLKAQVAALQARMDQAQGAGPPQPEPAGTEVAPPPETATTAAPAGAGNALLLPDISFIGTALSHLSTDKRDQGRSRIFLDSAEIGIQS